MTVATWSDWRAAVGADVPAGPHGTWTVRSCSDRRTSARWATWDVTFLAPAGTGQETVVLDLPGAGPQTLLAVPSAAHADGALLVATFVVPDDDPTGGDATAGDDPVGDDPAGDDLTAADDPTDPTHPTTDGTRGPAADAGTEA